MRPKDASSNRSAQTSCFLFTFYVKSVFYFACNFINKLFCRIITIVSCVSASLSRGDKETHKTVLDGNATFYSQVVKVIHTDIYSCEANTEQSKQKCRETVVWLI